MKLGYRNEANLKESNEKKDKQFSPVILKGTGRKNLNRIKSASGYGRRDKNRTFKSKDVLGVMLRDNQKQNIIVKPQIQK